MSLLYGLFCFWGRHSACFIALVGRIIKMIWLAFKWVHLTLEGVRSPQKLVTLPQVECCLPVKVCLVSLSLPTRTSAGPLPPFSLRRAVESHKSHFFHWLCSLFIIHAGFPFFFFFSPGVSLLYNSIICSQGNDIVYGGRPHWLQRSTPVFKHRGVLNTECQGWKLLPDQHRTLASYKTWKP